MKFRILTHFHLSNVTQLEVENVKKLEPTPAIPIIQSRAQIANYRHINSDKSRPWIYYVGGRSGSGLILLIVTCVNCNGVVTIPITLKPGHLPVLLILLQRTQTWWTPEWVP